MPFLSKQNKYCLPFEEEEIQTTLEFFTFLFVSLQTLRKTSETEPHKIDQKNIATKLISGVHRAPQQEKSIFRRCPETHQKNVNFANILKSGF